MRGDGLFTVAIDVALSPGNAKQIADKSIAAAAAGAAIIHLQDDGRPTNDWKVWQRFIDPIRAECDSLINMSASLGATAEERLDAVLKLKPDIATVIVGSMNYGLFRKAENQGVSEFNLDWEKVAFGPRSYEIVTNNNFAKIGKMSDMLEEAEIAVEFEAYDVGHLYVLEYHLRRLKQ